MRQFARWISSSQSRDQLEACVHGSVFMSVFTVDVVRPEGVPAFRTGVLVLKEKAE